MSRVTRFCERCGAQFTNPYDGIPVEICVYPIGPNGYAHDDNMIELCFCPRCAASLRSIIREFRGLS